MNTENKHQLTVTLNCASTDAHDNKIEYPFSLLLGLVIILTSVRQNKAQCIFVYKLFSLITWTMKTVYLFFSILKLKERLT